jgi:hypothetical protein
LRLTDRLLIELSRPVPLRSRIIRKLVRRFPIGSYEARIRAGAIDRPWYGWCLYYAAIEAKKLGHKAMTAIEFGVAGGSGLVCLCRHRDQVQELLGIEIQVVGFDSGEGLPSSKDPRDLLYCWPAGSFEMDRAKLEQRVAGRAELVLGDVSKTVPAWSAQPGAPLGAVMFDLDLYSSTSVALGVLTIGNILPRIWCYMDDILGSPANAYTDNIGTRAAIRDFNAKPERAVCKDYLSPAYTFAGLEPESWHQQIFLYHRLTHADYNTCVSGKHRLDLV